MKSRIDPRAILVGCVGWSLMVWAVCGSITALYLLFGDPDPKRIGATAGLLGLLFIGAGAATLGGEHRSDLKVAKVALKVFPSLRSEDGNVAGGLTFFGYMLVAGLQLLVLSLFLLD